MSFTEFDQEEYDRNRRAEGLSEGIAIGEQRGLAQGRNEGIEIGQQEKALETAKNLLSLKLLTDEQIATTIGISLEQVELLKQ